MGFFGRFFVVLVLCCGFGPLVGVLVVGWGLGFRSWSWFFVVVFSRAFRVVRHVFWFCPWLGSWSFFAVLDFGLGTSLAFLVVLVLAYALVFWSLLLVVVFSVIFVYVLVLTLCLSTLILLSYF